MEHLQAILYWLAGALTVLEILIRWGLPTFRKNPANANLVETIDSFWVAILVALFLKAVFLQPFTIPSGSMEDTLLPGDYILVKKYEYGYSFFNQTPRFLQFQKPQRGDVLVFVYPKDHSLDFIKRCIGLPGDVIELKNADLYLNGVKQDERKYVKHLFNSASMALEAEGPDSLHVNFGPVTVEPGHYFMMGDNRDNSMDSRYWGQLDEKLVKGKAWFIYWHSVHFRPDFHRMFKAIQ
jgi:signal peptidase I